MPKIETYDDDNNISDDDRLLGTDADNLNATKNYRIGAIKAYIANALGITPSTPSYKVYTALLSQNGTDAPVANVLENTLSGDVIWSRTSSGVYIFELPEEYDELKTSFVIGVGVRVDANYPVASSVFEIINSSFPKKYNLISKQILNSTGVITIADGYLKSTFFEIRIYD